MHFHLAQAFIETRSAATVGARDGAAEMEALPFPANMSQHGKQDAWRAMFSYHQVPAIVLEK
jgi:hypothetical protein